MINKIIGIFIFCALVFNGVFVYEYVAITGDAIIAQSKHNDKMQQLESDKIAFEKAKVDLIIKMAKKINEIKAVPVY